MRTRFAWTALLFLSAGTGCASFSTHLDAQPTPKGKVEFGAAVDALATKSGVDGETLIMPVLEVGLRYGFSDRADFGGKMSMSKLGGELNSRIAIVQDEAFQLTVVPSAGLAIGSVTSDDQTGPVVSFGLPVLAGITLGDAGSLVLGPKIYAHFGTIVASDDRPVPRKGLFVLYPGGVLGVALKLSDTFSIMPEINVMFPYVSNDKEFAKPLFQGGVGFMFDL